MQQRTNVTQIAQDFADSLRLPSFAMSDILTLFAAVVAGLLTEDTVQSLHGLPEPAMRAAVAALRVQLDVLATQDAEAQALTQALDVALEDGAL